MRRAQRGASEPRIAAPRPDPGDAGKASPSTQPDIEEIRAFTAGALATLPAEALSVAAGAPYLTVTPAPIEEETA